MSSTETRNDQIQPDPETPPNVAQMQAKRVFIGFAGTVIVGLALAGWYVGGRMFAAQKVHAASTALTPVVAPVAKKALSAPVMESQVAVAVERDVVHAMKEAHAWNTVDPQSGELYLQLATMGPNSTNDYLKILDGKGIHPKIAPGPTENLHRLVLGPYADKATREKEQQELEAAGIEFIAHRY